MELLQHFSLSEIIVFTALIILAFKGGISILDWFSERGQTFFTKTYQKPRELENTLKSLIETVQNLNREVSILVQSDKDAIKAFITRQHHYFVYQKGWIDDYSLNCIEQRYEHYKKEGGNSFIGTLMQELRRLPKQLPDNEQKQEDLNGPKSN